jgi:hypothetical protein
MDSICEEPDNLVEQEKVKRTLEKRNDWTRVVDADVAKEGKHFMLLLSNLYLQSILPYHSYQWQVIVIIMAGHIEKHK